VWDEWRATTIVSPIEVEPKAQREEEMHYGAAISGEGAGQSSLQSTESSSFHGSQHTNAAMFCLRSDILILKDLFFINVFTSLSQLW
jgi:hypothetical protein